MARRHKTTKRRQRKYQGHPALIAAAKRRNLPPDEEELEKRAIVRLIRSEMDASSEEGPLVGPLFAAAKYAAGKLCAQTPGLESYEHQLAVRNYLTERLGAAIDDFSVADYRAWRAQCISTPESERAA